MTWTINIIVTSTTQTAYALLMLSDVAADVLDVQDCRAEYQKGTQ